MSTAWPAVEAFRTEAGRATTCVDGRSGGVAAAVAAGPGPPLGGGIGGFKATGLRGAINLPERWDVMPPAQWRPSSADLRPLGLGGGPFPAIRTGRCVERPVTDTLPAAPADTGDVAGVGLNGTAASRWPR